MQRVYEAPARAVILSVLPKTGVVAAKPDNPLH
jgi:hypothetical protein